MSRNTILNLIFFILLIGSFLLGFVIQSRYQDTLIIPGSMTHAGDHDFKGTGKNGRIIAADLDFMHIKILNHPWNNPGIIEGLFLQGLLYTMLGVVLYIKLFKNG